jgi:transcription initiation factor TFIIH subunit 4
VINTPIADNPLQTAVLNLFVTFKTRFSNLIVGIITRESVKKALANGITGNQVRTLLYGREIDGLACAYSLQIISYIMTHAHPQMRKNVR